MRGNVDITYYCGNASRLFITVIYRRQCQSEVCIYSDGTAVCLFLKRVRLKYPIPISVRWAGSDATEILGLMPPIWRCHWRRYDVLCLRFRHDEILVPIIRTSLLFKDPFNELYYFEIIILLFIFGKMEIDYVSRRTIGNLLVDELEDIHFMFWLLLDSWTTTLEFIPEVHRKTILNDGIPRRSQSISDEDNRHLLFKTETITSSPLYSWPHLLSVLFKRKVVCLQTLIDKVCIWNNLR